MLKLFKIGLAGLILATATVSHADITDTYNKTCGTCHDSGVLNAPKKAMWLLGIS